MITQQLFHRIQDQLGPCQVDLFASRLTRQLPRYYSWRIDPEAEAVDAFTQDWSHHRGFANPPWCLIPRCLSQARAQKARLILLTPLWPSQPWYPVVLDMLEDTPRLLPTQEDLIFLHPGQEFQMPQGCPNLAYLRESFSSRGVSPEASKLLLSSWRPKTQSSYNSAFAKWASWCQQRNRDPTFGPIEDVVNFLSESFDKGFQYRSLNSYRSAISAVHSKVDGYSVGKHPLVSRLLKGAFNERPPLPRYSSFWNVDTVLGHFRGLGDNGSLSLKTLTLKTVMLMALVRPARSADLANLDIRDQSITDGGISFQPRHLSKQSRSSKPIQDFFYPRFLEDEALCPVQTLLAYEERTAAFRSPQA